jgi:hypothetical protein
MGGRLLDSSRDQSIPAGALLHTPPLVLVTQMGWLAGQALLAWVVIAIPTVLLLTFTLPLLLRRIPAVAAAEAATDGPPITAI